ncbi:MAG: right-handed parallel beta-helix repeat-containing protein [Acidobacteria bacterium]|nr:right-handed parallel beta-helix repeat-containing protein [Acidobacteriota bacterium]
MPRVAVLAAGWAAVALALPVSAAGTYEVGPGRPYASLGAVPWEALQPGDRVLIHWREQPYREKFVIARQGTAAAPIVVSGVPGPAGQLPVLDGDGATTRLALDYWNEERGVIKVGGASIPPDTMPRWIVIEGLDVRGARPPYGFSNDAGAASSYAANAAPIYVEKAEHLVIRYCELHDGGNGLFVASSGTTVSRDILIEGNYIHDNGNQASAYEHNSYTAAIGIVFQYNRYGPPTPGAAGNGLKDRSAGLVVRYNWIEGGNRQLDLVDAEDSSLIESDPAYSATHVYGNLLIEPEGAGNRQIVHYGGDSGNAGGYRKGTLFFHNNTIVSRRPDRTTLFRLSTNDERADARNNVVYTATAAGTSLSLVDVSGVLDWSHNWAKPGWRLSFDGAPQAVLHDDGTTVAGAAPGFLDETADDFRLRHDSACRDAGRALDPALLPDHAPTRHYRAHRASDPRRTEGALDIGAYESAFRVTGLTLAPDRRSVSWTARPDALSYDVVRGELAALGASGGSFSASLAQCVEDDSPDAATDDRFVPAAGSGTYLLARPNGPASDSGSWDDDADGLTATRDAGIAASPSACP